MQLGLWHITLTLTVGPEVQLMNNTAHSGKIMILKERVAPPEADGLIVHSQVDIPVAVATADCLPLVLVTPTTAAILHVSRKTTIRGVLDTLPHYFPIPDITGGYIGPFICPEHLIFEHLGDELAEFKNKFPSALNKSSNGLHLNLGTVVAYYLEKWNVGDQIIQRDGRCTFETPELPSYRRWLTEGKSGELGRIYTVVSKKA
jgi:copper oxidase (laccase) domain-containing protein